MSNAALNPYLPSYEYIPDAEPRVFGDRVYVYGSHDKFGGDTYCMLDYVCYSAPVTDLGDWRYEGVIYRRDQDPLNPDGSKYLYAPDCVQAPDGRYYLFYCVNGTGVTSVAVCDEPAGRYEFYGHVRHADGTSWGLGEGDVGQFDPGVLIDDDGAAYLFSGFSPNQALRHILRDQTKDFTGSFAVRLADDLLTIVEGPHLVAPGALIAAGTGYEGHEFFEASSPRKIDGRYYLVYSSMNFHELCYATSDTPLGRYEFGGTIVSAVDLGYHGNTTPLNHIGNTHGGLVEVAGQWYVFYHRHTNNTPFSRQAMAEPITIAPDGMIAQVETTSTGLRGGPLPGIGRYEARIACNLGARTPLTNVEAATADQPYFTQGGEDREQDGDQYLANLCDGGWAGFKYLRLGAATRITVSVRGSGHGEVVVTTTRDGEPVARLPITPSADWTEVSAPLHTAQGVLPLYFTYVGEGSLDLAAFELQEA